MKNLAVQKCSVQIINNANLKSNQTPTAVILEDASPEIFRTIISTVKFTKNCEHLKTVNSGIKDALALMKTKEEIEEQNEKEESSLDWELFENLGFK